MKTIRPDAGSQAPKVKDAQVASHISDATKIIKGTVLFVLAVLLGTAVSGFANAEPSCMTKAEARAAFPRANLYWHTAKHCWNNIPGGQRRYDAAKPVEKSPALPQAKPEPMAHDEMDTAPKPTVIPSRVPGTGVAAQDCTDGVEKWVLEGAAKGDPDKQTMLGSKCEKKDDGAASMWYQRAANQGEPVAQGFLGRMYEQGRGVPLDYVLAYMWLNLAAAKGDLRAKTNRDRIAAKMTRDQIAEAQKLGREWKPSVQQLRE
jgi:hypothetical protein